MLKVISNTVCRYFLLQKYYSTDYTEVIILPRYRESNITT